MQGWSYSVYLRVNCNRGVYLNTKQSNAISQPFPHSVRGLLNYGICLNQLHDLALYIYYALDKIILLESLFFKFHPTIKYTLDLSLFYQSVPDFEITDGLAFDPSLSEKNKINSFSLTLESATFFVLNTQLRFMFSFQ